jgi:hypothetical protein
LETRRLERLWRLQHNSDTLSTNSTNLLSTNSNDLLATNSTPGTLPTNSTNLLSKLSSLQLGSPFNPDSYWFSKLKSKSVYKSSQPILQFMVNADSVVFAGASLLIHPLVNNTVLPGVYIASETSLISSVQNHLFSNSCFVSTTTLGPPGKFTIYQCKDHVIGRIALINTNSSAWSSASFQNVLIAGSKGSCVLWDACSESSAVRPLCKNSDVLALSFQAPNSLYYGCRNGSIGYCDLRAQKPTKYKNNSLDAITCLRSHCNFLVTSTVRGDLKLYDTRNMKVPLWVTHGEVQSMNYKFTIVRSLIVTACQDGFMKAWDFQGTLVASILASRASLPLSCISSSASGHQMFAATEDRFSCYEAGSFRGHA